MSTEQTLLKALISIRDSKKCNLSGICSDVNRTTGWDQEAKTLLHKLMQKWPKYSGHENYPVPNPSGGHPRDAYYELHLWNRRTKYGRLRWELLEWLIQELETNPPKCQS